MEVDSTDLFMEEHLGMETACDAWIYVYPGQADASRLLIPFQKMMGDILTRRYAYEDPFEFQGIRPSEPFDEESIRIANSLSEMFLTQRIPVGIYSNAKDLINGKELHIMPGADQQPENQVSL